MMVRVPPQIGWPLVAAWGAGVFWFAAHRAVFHPFKYPQGFWEMQASLGAADVWLRAPDGVRLHGWWIAPPKPSLAAPPRPAVW